jgi:hypothetical protein
MFIHTHITQLMDNIIITKFPIFAPQWLAPRASLAIQISLLFHDYFTFTITYKCPRNSIFKKFIFSQNLSQEP